ncbi:hypothetical protein BKA67DRAFT_577817 [Truncatella angustata]|uniref:Uncharacterized protein n=1 Tax=Truncatella angustata TaxID=152316 RepID=A0A9P8RK52_9PEZI|nr:uncharacterized protein BKA67DRAFT_577817 [Truncatella angustata]KAH6647545.1 hypothetical protein BKA67DRAFT_577817 [Truncatella angustata]
MKLSSAIILLVTIGTVSCDEPIPVRSVGCTGNELNQTDIAAAKEKLVGWGHAGNKLIKDKCGEGRSGWVWSKQWEKGFNLQSLTVAAPRRPAALCPLFCIYPAIHWA